MKRSTALRGALALATAGALLVGCSGSPGGSDGPTEITFMWLWGPEEDGALREIVEEFNASQDEIVVTGVSSPDFQKQITQMSSSTGAFDISDNFGLFAANWADKGILTPLDEYIERDNFDLSDFVPAALKANQFDGSTYALPISLTTQQLYYNVDLLAEAGFDGPPETFEELAEMIPALTKTDADGRITQLGLGQLWGEVTLNAFVTSMGGSFYGDNPDAPMPDTPEVREALQFYYDNLVAPFGEGRLAEFQSGYGESFSPEHPFYTGKLAMYIDGAYLNNAIQTYAPDLNYATAPFPHPADKPQLANAALTDNANMFIPANSKNKDAAWEFMKFLFTKQNVLKFSHSQSNMPGYLSLADDPAYQDLPAGFQSFLNVMVSPNLTAPPATVWAPDFRGDFLPAFDNLVSGRATPDDVMNVMIEAAAKYGG